MSRVTVELDIPRDLEKFRLPTALNRRLQELLDRQDKEGHLSPSERGEARALSDLADMLTLLRLKATDAPKSST